MSEEDTKQEEVQNEADLVRVEREKLKAENDAFEAEKLRAEKLRAEKMLAPTAGGHIDPVVEDPAQKVANEIAGAFK